MLLKWRCLSLLASWTLIVAGLYIYDRFGLGYAFVPFFVAAVLRGDGCRSIQGKLSEKGWKIGSAIYYGLLLPIALMEPELFLQTSGAMFVLILGLPLFVVAILDDVRSCIGKSSAS